LNAQPRPRSIYQHIVPCAGILVLATIIMLPAFVRSFPAGFDAVRHYRWTSQFIDALRDGALYPRWLPTANGGQGSPTPLYYPPLSFYVASGFSFVTGNVLLGMSLSCWLALALSGLTFYAFSRPLLSPRLSFAAATLYLMAPYHLLDLYQGSTVSEFWSFAWIPLLLDGVRRVSATPGLRGIAYVALSYGLLVLTHVPVLFLTSVSLVVYALLLNRNMRALLRIASGLALGAGMAAIFLIPVLFETRYIKLFFKFDYRDYFLFEHVRAALTSNRFPIDGSPYTYLLDTELVGVGILVLFLISSLVIWMNWRSTEKGWTSSTMCLAIWIVTAFSLFMTTRLSAPIWRITPGLSFLFFPYRWLVVASAGTYFLAALSISLVMGVRKWHIIPIGALSIAVILNLSISAFAILRAPAAPDGFAAGLARRDTREYRPVWWNGQLREEVWRSAAVVESGNAEVRAIDETGIEQSYAVRADTESIIALRPLYFPGWVARVDTGRIEIAPGADGHVQLSIEPGEHELTLRFEDTWPRTLGKLVSAVSVLIFLAVLWRKA
jgi:uncharacterized membrane protein